MKRVSPPARVVMGFLALWIAAAMGAAAQPAAESAWKLGPDQYAAYEVDGMLGIRHFGFFGHDIDNQGRLKTEPKHPALLSLPLVTLLPPGKPRKGQSVKMKLAFSFFEAYTPVNVAGTVRVTDVIGPLLFLKGAFKLGKAKAQGKDGRFYQVTGGELTFSSQFNLETGLLNEAAVRFSYTYDMRVGLEALYGGGSMKQERGVKVEIPHIIRLTGVINKKDMPGLIDAYIDDTKASFIEEWGGTSADGHNYALKPGYDALYLLALLHAKEPKKSELLQKVATRLRNAPVNSTYAAALILMAIEAMNTSTEELLHPEQFRDKEPVRNLSADDRRVVERCAKYLVKGQMAGGWTYVAYNDDKKFFPRQFGNPDNSNTQFALMGLFAAMRMGAKIDPKTWRKALGFWQRNVTRTGFKPKGARQPIAGWAYDLHGRGTAYLAMTAGGLASLSIIAKGLGVKPGDKSKDGRVIGRLMDTAMTWLEHYYTVRVCRRARLPGPDFAEDWAYHLYALERACDLTRIQKIKHHDWYLEGAMAILNGTYEDIKRDHAAEALQLLFLRRSTPPAVTAPPR